MAILKGINLAVAFLLELVMVVVYGYWGFQASDNLLVRIVLGIGAPLVAIAIWGVFMAPRSNRRLRGAAYWLVELVLYGLVVLALLSLGYLTLALIFGVVAVVSALLIVVWKQDEPQPVG